MTEPYFPFHNGAVEEFTIGSERCEPSGRAYCNGPLRPGAAYYVKLRAYTARDKFTDTAYALVYTGARRLPDTCDRTSAADSASRRLRPIWLFDPDDTISLSTSPPPF